MSFQFARNHIMDQTATRNVISAANILTYRRQFVQWSVSASTGVMLATLEEIVRKVKYNNDNF